MFIASGRRRRRLPTGSLAAAVLAAEVPRDAAADGEVVAPPCRPRRRPAEPLGEVLGEQVADAVAEPPQVAADVEARVVGHVHRGGARRVGGEAAVPPHPLVEDHPRVNWLVSYHPVAGSTLPRAAGGSRGPIPPLATWRHMSVHSDSVRQSRRRSELNRLGSSCMYTYLPAHLSLLAGRPRRGGGGGGDVDGGGGDASMIGGGGGVSPARCTGNVTVGGSRRGGRRRPATAREEEEHPHDAGRRMISGARHRPSPGAPPPIHASHPWRRREPPSPAADHACVAGVAGEPLIVRVSCSTN